MNTNNVDTDFASDMLDEESENFSGTNQPDADIKDLLEEELADLENMTEEFRQSNFQSTQQEKLQQNTSGTEDFKEAARKRLDGYFEKYKADKMEAEKKKETKQEVEKSTSEKTENLSGTPAANDKSFVEKITDWAVENPLTALAGILGIGAIAYSISHNKEKQAQSVRIRKRKHKSYKSYLEEKEQLEGTVSKTDESSGKEAIKPTKSFLETFKETFKTEKITEDNKVVETVDTTNVVTAVTAAATAATVAAKLPVAIGGISALALAGIGYSMGSPVMMLAGAGLAAGLLITHLLPKTVKSGAEPAANNQGSTTSASTEQAVSGVKENAKTTTADSQSNTKSFGSTEKNYAISVNPPNDWFGQYEKGNSTGDIPFGSIPSNKYKSFQKEQEEAPEFEFSDTM